MPSKKIAIKDTERLDNASILRAIEFMENKGTKKGACEILNISYNTTRLDKIINKYHEDVAYEKKRRAEKRGTPATESEISYVITSYLEGSTVDSISTSLYRSAAFVNNILDKYSVPRRGVTHSYFKPEMVPEKAMRDLFHPGELVYSMRYDSLAVINSMFSPGVYRLYLLSEKQKQFAYQPVEELASLQHLIDMGITLKA